MRTTQFPANPMRQAAYPVFVLLSAIGACGGSSVASTTASMFRGNASHSGVSDSTAAAFTGILWRFPTEGPVRSSPTIVGDEVFVGSGDGRLYALSLTSGEERWRTEVGESVASGPLVTADAVGVTTLNGSIVRVDRTTGRITWHVRTGATAPLVWGFEGTDYYSSSPVLAGDLLIAGAADGNVYGLSWSDGSIRWQVKTDGRVRSSPAVADSTVYVGSYDGKVYAIDVATGKTRWTYSTAGVELMSAQFGYDRRSIQSSPVVAGDRLLIGARDGNLYALDRHTGREIWKSPHDETSWVIASPAVRDSLIVDASSDAHFVRVLRARDGSEIWRQKTFHSVWGSPVIAGNLVFISEGAYSGHGRGIVRSYDLASGVQQSLAVLGGPVLSTPAISGKTLVVGSDDGGVYALSLGASTLQRAVYWDTTAVNKGLGQTAARIRDHFRGRGYQLVDSKGLRDWMTARIADSARSVVVFAIDHLPPEVAATSSDTTLFRSYLNDGGKVMWTGLPPHMWLPDSAGHFTLSSFGKGGTAGLLGRPVSVEPWDRYGAVPTALGRSWGLTGWWLTAWSSPVVEGAEVLARDERGYAAAWLVNYSGASGTGFVQLGRPVWDEESLRQLAIAAEYIGPPRPAAR